MAWGTVASRPKITSRRKHRSSTQYMTYNIGQPVKCIPSFPPLAPYLTEIPCSSPRLTFFLQLASPMRNQITHQPHKKCECEGQCWGRQCLCKDRPPLEARVDFPVRLVRSPAPSHPQVTNIRSSLVSNQQNENNSPWSRNELDRPIVRSKLPVDQSGGVWEVRRYPRIIQIKCPRCNPKLTDRDRTCNVQFPRRMVFFLG